MTREEAIKRMGLAMVESAEADNCEFWSRSYDGWETWRGCSHRNENGEVCVAIYYMRQEETEVEDLGSLTWIIDHYEIA